jgi:glyoxylase-like metal-dependent hydrolase (beta-lactamase superfamily II)
VRLLAFNCGVELVDIANFDPLGPEVGLKVFSPYFFYVVEHERGHVLFDTGANPAWTGRIDPAAAAAQVDGPRIVVREGEDVISRLASIGVTPEAVAHVALSHLHIDHAGGVGALAGATFYVQRRELEAAFRPPVYQREFYVREDFDHPVQWQELDGEHDLFGDGRIVLFPTPGHSMGHQSMLVRLDGGAVILVADAAYSPRNLDERRLPAIVWSPDAMVESWERIEALRDREDAQLIFTHDLDWRARTRLAPEAWYS